MKTRILTVITLLALVVATSKTTYASSINNASTTLTDVKHINKIEVRGNVELYVSDGATDNIKVYDKYYSESALVQNQNGVLRISSYKAEKLVVWVTAAQLESISAYDNSTVKSFGKVSAINLNVNLYNHASANLNIQAFAANINVNDQAKANLAGNVDQCVLTHNQAATVNSTKFVTNNMNSTINHDLTIKAEQVAGL